MAKGRRKTKTGTDKQTLAAVETPVAMHDAALPVVNGAMHDMTTTTTSAERGLQEQKAKGEEQSAAAGNAAMLSTSLNEPATPEPGDDSAAHAAPAPSATSAKAPEMRIEFVRTEMRLDAAAEAPPGSIGPRLRAAREARNWSVDEVSTRLHIPLQIIRALEAEQFEKIGYGVYLRGYLMSYARLVDVPTILVDSIVRERNQTPPLVASGTISHSRYLYQRYSVSALYLILTGVIIVPAVLLAMRAGLQPAVTQVTPLDASAVSAPADATTAAKTSAEPGAAIPAPASTAAADGTAASAPAEAPLVASLAPFSALSHKDVPHGETAAAVTPATPAPVAGAHTLKLSLKESSWVEIVSASGEKLEYGLLPAGTTRTYTSDKVLDVRLGNSNGAEIEADGQVRDLAPYRRSNVARFRLFAAGEPISRIDQ